MTEQRDNLFRPQSPRPSGHDLGNRSPAGGGGFTLVELMTVIAVIALLLAILIPSLMQIKTQIQRSASLTMVRMLDSACEAYFNDFDDYPPSRRPDGADYLPDWDGKYLLPLLLTGYGPDAEDPGIPFEGGRRLDQDDGKSEFGFRVVARGVVYGPYHGTEDIRMQPAEDTDGPPAFVDSFGNQVFYYRFDQEDETYHEDHNGPDMYGPHAPQEPDMPDYARRNDGEFIRRDFILCTKGPDFEFEAFGENPATDDVTNFLQEQ
ncbi:MAG: competence type IV pilus major pilin ComGC [Phycisphaerae bacterium]